MSSENLRFSMDFVLSSQHAFKLTSLFTHFLPYTSDVINSAYIVIFLCSQCRPSRRVLRLPRERNGNVVVEVTASTAPPLPYLIVPSNRLPHKWRRCSGESTQTQWTLDRSGQYCIVGPGPWMGRARGPHWVRALDAHCACRTLYLACVSFYACVLFSLLNSVFSSFFLFFFLSKRDLGETNRVVTMRSYRKMRSQTGVTQITAPAAAATILRLRIAHSKGQRCQNFWASSRSR